MFEPTSILILPIFINVPPLFLCHGWSGDNILAFFPICMPDLFPDFTPNFAAVLKPALATCEAPAIIPPVIKPSANPSTAAPADFFNTVLRLSPEAADLTAVVVALIPAEIPPAIQAAFIPPISAGAAAPPVATVAITPTPIAAAPITIFPTFEDAKSFTAPAAFFIQSGHRPV